MTDAESLRVELRPLERADHEAVHAILAQPSVAPWWSRSSDDLADELEDPQAIVVDGELAGVVDIWEENEPGYRHGGLDIFLAEGFQDRGVGRAALRLAANVLFEDRGHHRITIDPAVANDRAIRCYEAVGFRRVGVMRRYERAPDGSWRDGLLMDLLPEDLR